MKTEKRSITELVPSYIDVYRTALANNLIVNKVGLTFVQTKGGNAIFPFIDSGLATIDGESVAIDPVNKISNIKAEPKTVFKEITISRGALERGNMREEMIKELARSTARTLNKWLISPTLITTNTSVKGVFVKDKTVDANNVIQLVGEVPTFSEIVEMEKVVLNANVYDEGKAMYVISPLMAAKLKITPKATGGEVMIYQDGKINDYPVAITKDIPDTVLGFGFFSHTVVSELFPLDVVYDDITGAGEDLIKFSSIVDYDINVMNKEAFSVAYTPTGYAEIFPV